MLSYIQERKIVLRIYSLLIVSIVSGPLLSMFVQTSLSLWINLFCYIDILYLFLRLNKYGALSRLTSVSSIILLFICNIIILYNANWPNNIKDIIAILVLPSGGVNYIIPFVILFLPNSKYRKDILQLFFYSALIVFPFWLLTSEPLIQEGFRGEIIGCFLPFFAAFILGFPQYFTKSKYTVIIVIWGIYLLLMLLNARRNVVFSLTMYAVVSYIVVNISNIKRNKVRFFILSIVMCIGFLSISLCWDTLKGETFKAMSDRVDEDTRSGVEELFWLDFSQASASDWIIGRGMHGGYYQVMKNEDTGEITDNRQVIETGYLFLLLKGGLLYVICIVSLMILSIKRGFELNGAENKYITIILCIYVIDFYTTSPLQYFGVRSLLFWFIIGCLLTKKKSYKIILRK